MQNKLINSLPVEYKQDILVRMTYNSTAIEGNTVSLAETASILIERVIPKRVTVREFYEVENHRQTLEYVFECVEQDLDISEKIIRDIHALLMENIIGDAGGFKKQPNVILGSMVELAKPWEVPMLIRDWTENLKFRLNASNCDEELIEVIADQHIKFERIHPFSDGNGRTGRMLMLYSALKSNVMPIIIQMNQRSDYMQCLRNEDAGAFKKMIMGLLEQEKERFKGFEYKNSVKIEGKTKGIR